MFYKNPIGTSIGIEEVIIGRDSFSQKKSIFRVMVLTADTVINDKYPECRKRIWNGKTEYF